MIVIGGALLYLSAYSPLRRWLQRTAGVGGRAPAPGAAAAAGNAAAPGGAAAAGQDPNGGPGAAPGGGGGQGAAPGDVGGAADAAAAQGGPAAAAPPPRRGMVQELQALLIGFFTSLLPGCGQQANTIKKLARSTTAVVQNDEESNSAFL